MTKRTNLVPKRRFKEFLNTHVWEQRKLGDVADISSGYTGDSMLNDGKYQLTRIETISDAIVNEDRVGFTNKQPDESYRLNKGDILYSNINSISHIGKVAIYEGNKPLYHGINLLRLVIGKQNCPFFMFYQLNTESKKNWAKAHANQAVSQASINQTLLSKQRFMVCKFDEQTQIGTFFRHLDNLITLHQRKLEKMKALKSAYLSEMFPAEGECKPKRRFAGFTQAWEQRKLGDIFNILDGDRGKNYPGESDFYENGATLFLDTGNVKKNGFDFSTKKYITKEKDESLRSGKLELHDFVLTSRGTLGNVAYYDEKTRNNNPFVRINSAMLILRPAMSNQVSDDYMATVLRGNIIDTFMSTNHVGSAQPHITKHDFSKVSVGIPSILEEQTKIGSFFKHLDEIITLHQRKLEKLQNIKKAYLNEMFI